MPLVHNSNHDKLFEGVDFVVRATDNERHFLWCLYHDTPNPKFPDSKVDSWEQEMLGTGAQIGTFQGYPLVVSVSYARLNGKRVAFVSDESQVVHRGWQYEWLNKHFFSKNPYNNARTCDAINFGRCVSFVRGEP